MPGTSKGRTDRATLNKAKQEFSTAFNQGSDVMRRCPGKIALVSSGEQRGQASQGVGERAWQQKLPAPQGTATWSIFPPASPSLQTLTPVHTGSRGTHIHPTAPQRSLPHLRERKIPPNPPVLVNGTSQHCSRRGTVAPSGPRSKVNARTRRALCPPHTHTHPTLVPEPSHRQQTSGDK